MFLVFRVGTAASGVELQVLSDWNTYFYLVLMLRGALKCVLQYTTQVSV